MPVKTKIDIKNGVLKGFINVNNKRYILEGNLDEANEKYVGKVTNYDGYTFEAFIIDETNGYILINIFTPEKMPTSYVISDRKSKTTKSEIPNDSSKQINDSSFYTSSSMLNTTESSDYYDELLTVAARGIYYQVEGPISINAASWRNHIIVRTYVDDAWADSGINNLIHYAGFIINNRIGFHPENSDAVFAKDTPNSNSTTSFSFPFYFGSIIGFQNIPVTTSTTTVSDDGRNVTYSFTWTPLIAYLDEANSTYYAGKKLFGGAVWWSVTQTGYKTNDVSVYLQYEVIGKKYDTGSNYYAYPSYSNTSSYVVSVHN
ncbi:MAG: hypothetical protein QJR05_14885 [Thermoanaerobacterium sp.]|nr:hypothetical protein [Thermoanaerobacterium sp.]